MVHEGDTAGGGKVGDRLCRTNPADASAIDLDKPDATIGDQMLRHRGIVGGLASGELDLRAALGERRIG